MSGHSHSASPWFLRLLLRESRANAFDCRVMPDSIMDPGAYSAFSISEYTKYLGTFTTNSQSARTSGYDVEWQLNALRELRKARIAELTKIAKTFPKDVKVLIHVVHGGTERKILAAAEQHVSCLSTCLG